MADTMTLPQYEAWAKAWPDVIEGDHSPLLKEMRQPVFAGISANFTRSAAPDGTPWPPRKRLGDGHPLLIKSGDLYQASTSTFGEGHVEQISDSVMIVGVEIEYAAGHQYGRGRVPARPFMAIGEDVVDQLVEMAADHYLDLILKAA